MPRDLARGVRFPPAPLTVVPGGPPGAGFRHGRPGWRCYPVTRDCAICMGHFFMLKPPTALTRVLLAGLLLVLGGCAWLRPAPTPILPPDELYSQGESELERRRYLEARDS